MSVFLEEIMSSGDLVVSTAHRNPYYSANSGRPMDGVVRINCGKFEYYNGSSNDWQPTLGSTVKIELNSIHRDALDWAMNKMLKEQQEAALAEKYPAFKAAKQNYELVKAMVENE